MSIPAPGGVTVNKGTNSRQRTTLQNKLYLFQDSVDGFSSAAELTEDEELADSPTHDSAHNTCSEHNTSAANALAICGSGTKGSRNGNGIHSGNSSSSRRPHRESSAGDSGLDSLLRRRNSSRSLSPTITNNNSCGSTVVDSSIGKCVSPNRLEAGAVSSNANFARDGGEEPLFASPPDLQRSIRNLPPLHIDIENKASERPKEENEEEEELWGIQDCCSKVCGCLINAITNFYERKRRVVGGSNREFRPVSTYAEV